jgi:hypothetical protein
VRVRARAKRTSNICFMSVTLEVSKLTGWLNADAPCRVEGGHVQYGTRCGQVGGRAWGRRRKRHARGKGPTPRLGGQGTRAERTENIMRMFVTLDVSQLEMSALKFFEFWKREPMSVMAETHQSAMGPYVAMAKAAFESNSVTAVFREPLLVKVWVQAPVGEVEGGGGEGDGGGGLGLSGNGVVQLPGAQLEP